ncbi:hypothetical protein NQT62_09980 [Limnobacter humi]|uniref:DUF2946 domain-containing protein n=1 Tax=Limnobacter humi TaxID=1778671 RepID=A0ABT1WH78_9BURK|nr:hypothetical protein [Limnobacter humi]MCQ8896759.1 hypothetical protein [Limnobacter humi]
MDRLFDTVILFTRVPLMKAVRWLSLVVLCGLVLKLGMQAMPCCMEWPSFEAHSSEQHQGPVAEAATQHDLASTHAVEPQACFLKVAVASPVLALFNMPATQHRLPMSRQSLQMPPLYWLDAAVALPFKPPKA